MDSTEKLIAFLEALDQRPDEELAQILPVPPKVARMAITAASFRVPTDAAQLDEWALQAAVFCLSMRGDDAPAYALVADANDAVHNAVLAPAAPMFAEPGSLEDNRSGVDR